MTLTSQSIVPACNQSVQPNQKDRQRAIQHVSDATQRLKNVSSPSEFLDLNQAVALVDFLEDDSQ